MDLLSYQTHVETPFIIVKIGDYTFGSYEQTRSGNTLNVRYPNFMQAVEVTKINGDVNTYSIKMVYQVSQNDDPNLLDKVFGTISSSRQIKVSYGDWSSPSFIYKEESAIVTKISTNVDFSGSKIEYTLRCTSDALSLKSAKFDFPARYSTKPSTVIRELLSNSTYGLVGTFYGMSDLSKVTKYNLIPSDDKAVNIEKKSLMDPLTYLNYLVNCMTPLNDSKSSAIKSSKYYLSIVDEVNNNLNGPYFKITRVDTSVTATDSFDTYTVDVGYPGNNFVTNFSIKNDEEWSILYNYSQKVNQTDYIYKIDNNGEMGEIYSPSITTSSSLYKTTEQSKSWWTQVTQFPVQATLTIKGLLRPAMLMSYIRINAYFYGRKHISSGLYIVTKQIDSISSSGYKTTLSLLRIGEDK